MENLLKRGTLKDGVYYFPEGELDRKEYLDVAKHLKFAGGKWNKGKKGFVFDREINSIEELLGDNKTKQKELQFFETPEPLADRLVEMADLQRLDIILEPSAGRGRIIKAIRKVLPDSEVELCEIDPTNRKYLEEFKNTTFVIADFLEIEQITYDKIIANPPFSKNQDIDHIRKMYSLLTANGGVLVSMASTHWQFATGKKEVEFKEWLTEVNAEIFELEIGEFKESGTNIPTNIIRIKK